MSIRRKGSQLIPVSAPQTVSEGRRSRANTTGELAHRPTLAGEDGARGVLAIALAEPALHDPSASGAAKDKALEHVRYARKRLRGVMSRDQARDEEADLRLAGRDLAALRHVKSADDRARLLEAVVDAVGEIRKAGITSRVAKRRFIHADRLLALASILTDAFLRDGDRDALRLALSCASQADRTLLTAREHERASRADHRESFDGAGAMALLEAHRRKRQVDPGEEATEGDADSGCGTEPSAASDDGAHGGEPSEGSPRPRAVYGPASAGAPEASAPTTKRFVVTAATTSTPTTTSTTNTTPRKEPTR